MMQGEKRNKNGNRKCVKKAVDEIASLENISAEKNEIDEALAHVAMQNGITMEQLKELYNDDFEKAVVRSIIIGKVMHLIREAAEITVK